MCSILHFWNTNFVTVCTLLESLPDVVAHSHALTQNHCPLIQHKISHDYLESLLYIIVLLMHLLEGDPCVPQKNSLSKILRRHHQKQLEVTDSRLQLFYMTCFGLLCHKELQTSIVQLMCYWAKASLVLLRAADVY